MVKNVCRVYHSAERFGDICGVFPFDGGGELQTVQRCVGDGGWTRTTDQLINSQPLYHWATPSYFAAVLVDGQPGNQELSRNLHFTLVPDEACGSLT